MTETDKREAIFQAALELLAERGFHNTPMSLLARRAGASAGIIYHYFASKDDLIHALYQRIKVGFSQALLLGVDIDRPSPEQFSRLWHNAYAYYIANPHATIFLEQYEISPYARGTAEASTDPNVVRINAMLAAYQARGILKPLPFAAIYELTLGVAARLARQQIAGRSSLNNAELAEVAAACWQAVVLER